MAKILGIDYGMKRIGLALSDEKKTIAFPLKTFPAGKTPEESALLLKQFLFSSKNLIEAIVVGFPLCMNGSTNEMTCQVERFANTLKTLTSLPLFFLDERLTSSFAETSLKQMGLNRKKRTQHSDTFSACVILQNYLDLLQRKASLINTPFSGDITTSITNFNASNI